MVSQRLGCDGDSGFLDTTGIEPGTSWTAKLEEALRTTRAFIPILSPRYFERQYCGKEWAAFRRRLSEQSPPPLIQPILLSQRIDIDPMPPAVGSIQLTHDTYPECYQSRGLSYLLSVPAAQNDYWEFVHAFANVLVSALRAHELEPADAIPPLADVQSIFHDPATQEQIVDLNAPPGRRLFAQFIYVAAKQTELAELRSERSAYGDEGGLDWQPYYPDLDLEIGMLAAEVATNERFRYEPLPLDAQLITRLQDAAQRNKIVIVVVDAWTVRLDSYQCLMKELDGRSFPNCVVIIPINERDPETTQSRHDLSTVIEATFVNRALSADNDAFAPWIQTPEALRAELAAKLTSAKLRVIKTDAVVRKARGLNLITSLPKIDASPMV